MRDYKEHLKQVELKYFSEEQKYLRLKEGDILLHENEVNNRMFFIKKGTLVGIINDSDENQHEVFRSCEGMIVGVYSFFSIEHKSYTTVKAVSDVELAYLEAKDHEISDGEFAQHFLPISVNEIYIRQKWAQKVHEDRQQLLTRLYQNEKMAMLGQMAAGLAHELNNAIGLIESKVNWLKSWITSQINQDECQPYFNKGMEDGHPVSTSELRQLRKSLEKEAKLNSIDARRAADLGLSLSEAKAMSSENLKICADYLCAGRAFHDISISTKQAAHVVSSVKELGLTRKLEPVQTDVNKTIHEAIALAKPVMKNIELEINLEDLPSVMARPGDLVQVWLNLIKNGVEAMQSSNTNEKTLSVSSANIDDKIAINIMDSGPGIPAEYIQEIFHPNVSTKVHGLNFGLGLGLTITQRIVTDYGGEIKVTSKPGETIFNVLIPIEN